MVFLMHGDALVILQILEFHHSLHLNASTLAHWAIELKN